jgi:hypothetical protein
MGVKASSVPENAGFIVGTGPQAVAVFRVGRDVFAQCS